MLFPEGCLGDCIPSWSSKVGKVTGLRSAAADRVQRPHGIAAGRGVRRCKPARPGRDVTARPGCRSVDGRRPAWNFPAFNSPSKPQGLSAGFRLTVIANTKISATIFGWYSSQSRTQPNAQAGKHHRRTFRASSSMTNSASSHQPGTGNHSIPNVHCSSAAPLASRSARLARS